LSRSASSPARIHALLIAAGVAAAALGCAAVEHARDTQAYVGRTLAAGHGDGAARLAAEARLDPALRDYLAEHGRPDYLRVMGRQKVYLFYTRSDAAVMFERELATSRVTELGRIPGSMLELLPPAEARRISAQRAERGRREKARARAQARPAPAAPSPSAGTYFGTFDAKQIVERMTPPMTAADPGVRSWRQGRTANGTRSFAAKVGGTQYEVRPDRVVMSSAIAAKRRSLPTSARLGVTRINQAIFAQRAEAITDAVIPLAERVSEDPSGRTRFDKRIAGRTVRIARDPRRGRLVYSVHP
jgi:hypothetical protein